MYYYNCDQEHRLPNIDFILPLLFNFILPLFVGKALHNGTENAEQICIRAIVKGFSLFII